MESKEPLGLIAGNGKFPLLFAQKAKSQSYNLITAGIKGDTSFLIRFLSDQISFFKVGELEKLFCYFKLHGVKKVIMAGQVNPDNLFDQKVKLDQSFQKIFDAIENRKADTIFAAVAQKLKEEGMELLDSTFLLKDLLAPKGTITKRGPTLLELEDIAFGKNIAKMMGGIDVGQTVVVKEKAIVAIEAMEGTDSAIRRGSAIAREGAVIIKMSKPNQDFRFDVPVIGLRTIMNMSKFNAKCLCIEAEKTLIINRAQCVKKANQAGISIVAN